MKKTIKTISNDKFMNNIMKMLRQYEKDLMSQRIKKGLAHKKMNNSLC